MSREEIEQVEKELDEVLEIVQRPVPVKNTGREETVSLQENLQENDPLQEEMQIETEKEEKEEKGCDQAITWTQEMEVTIFYIILQIQFFF